jgi:16S rRNA (guanine(966)-N(2))-methyltransferase RsmD
MRIIAGEKRRMQLRSPRGERTRPTTDRVRESLFAWLGPRLEGARVLDLFAGAGTLGLEALSRGARAATFVDSSRGAIQALHENVTRLGLKDRARIVSGDALRFLGRGPSEEGCYDLIFADPPYGRDLGRRLLERLAARAARWLSPEGLVLIQTGRRDDLDLQSGTLEREATREHGETRIHVYHIRSAAEATASRPEEAGECGS